MDISVCDFWKVTKANVNMEITMRLTLLSCSSVIWNLILSMLLLVREIFLLFKTSRPVLKATPPLIQWVPGYILWEQSGCLMKLLNLQSRLRVSGTLPLNPHRSSCHIQGKIYLICTLGAFINLGGWKCWEKLSSRTLQLPYINSINSTKKLKNHMVIHSYFSYITLCKSVS